MPKKKTPETGKPKSGNPNVLGLHAAVVEQPITDTASREANYSNESGVGYNRYQKNIMGMWIVNELKKEKRLE